MPLPPTFWEAGGHTLPSLPKPTRSGIVFEWSLMGQLDIPVGRPILKGLDGGRIGRVTSVTHAPGAFGGFTTVRGEIDTQVWPSLDSLLQLEPSVEPYALALVQMPEGVSQLVDAPRIRRS